MIYLIGGTPRVGKTTLCQQLSANYQIRSVFRGCSLMTLEIFDKFTRDIPHWSGFIKREANRFNYPYIDMSDGFQSRLMEAVDMLTKL